jgi:C4-type Zn-finger protein
MPGKDCPMCSEIMQLIEREVTDRVPGTPQTKTAKVLEWVCPECDYFQEWEKEDAEDA